MIEGNIILFLVFILVREYITVGEVIFHENHVQRNDIQQNAM